MTVHAAKSRRLGVGIMLGAMGLFLLGLAPLLPFSDLAPLSLVTVIPALLGASLGRDSSAWIFAGAMCGALVAPVIFILIGRSIVNGRRTVSKTSLVAFLALVILAYGFAILAWADTVLFTSMRRALALEVQCIVPPLILIAVLLGSRNRLTKKRALMLHWFAMAWFTWSAFPWWGELL